MLQLLTMCLCSIFFVLPAVAFTQEDRVVIDKSQLPLEANAATDFVPTGWDIAARASGDLNGDSVPDLALTLIQEKRAGSSEDAVNDRQRALVILFKGTDGKLHRAAVADRLLQCTACGGAFYGVVEAPADVKIEKGVLIVNQDHGSRNVTEQTFRFRYQPGIKRLVLIGLDVVDRDRATGTVVQESTNFLTGRKMVTRIEQNERLNKETTKRTSRTVAKNRITIEQVDSEKY